MAGITVVSDSVAFARDGRFEPDVRLTVNGTDVAASAIGIASGRHRTLMLRFDPLPLIRRHADGFRLVLYRGEAAIDSFDLKGASAAFGELAACAGSMPKPGGAEDRSGR